MSMPVVLGFIFLSNSLAVTAQPNTSSVKTFGTESQPYGLSYAGWTAKWWDWMISAPLPSNPIVDETGEYCSVGQSGPVWYLGGTVGGSADRRCAIPEGKAILFPIINSMCDFAGEPTISSEAGLLACAKTDTDQAINMRATIDGIDLKSSRVQSTLSDITFPENNIYGAPSGDTQMVSDGYWVFLQPLPKGDHQLSFSGETATSPALGISAFATSVNYDILVQ
jgi:hypothetical protein